MRGALRIDVVDTGDSTLLDLGGELTSEEGRSLFDAVEAALGTARPYVQIGMAGVAFLDSSGISELLRARDRVTAHDKALQIVEPSPVVVKVLAATDLLSVFDVVDPPSCDHTTDVVHLRQIRRAPDGGGAEPDQPDPAPAVGTAADEGATASSSAART